MVTLRPEGDKVWLEKREYAIKYTRLHLSRVHHACELDHKACFDYPDDTGGMIPTSSPFLITNVASSVIS